jgi:hypothetical protein
MIDFYNIPDNFIRDLRHILIYDANEISYIDMLNAKFPSRVKYKYNFAVLPGSAKRSIPTKFDDSGNAYFDVDISFNSYELNAQNRVFYYQNFNKGKRYAIVLVSNTDMIMLGNDREPMAIAVSDAIQDNNAGNDTFTFSITGQTILYPRPTEVIDAFRVLLLLPPTL